MSTSKPKPRRKLAIRVAAFLLVALLVDRYVVPSFVLSWLGDANVIDHDDFVPAVGGESAEQAAREFALNWLGFPGLSLIYISRDQGLEIDIPEFFQPQLPEDDRVFPRAWSEQDLRSVTLDPITSSDGKAFLATVALEAIFEDWTLRFVVVQGRRGRWFAAAEGLEQRARRAIRAYNEGSWVESDPTSASDNTPELDFTKP